MDPDDQGEPILRVRFTQSAEGEQRREKSLRLRDEWHRLAIPTSLTDEVGLSGSGVVTYKKLSIKRHVPSACLTYVRQSSSTWPISLSVSLLSHV